VLRSSQSSKNEKTPVKWRFFVFCRYKVDIKIYSIRERSTFQIMLAKALFNLFSSGFVVLRQFIKRIKFYN